MGRQKRLLSSAIGSGLALALTGVTLRAHAQPEPELVPDPPPPGPPPAAAPAPAPEAPAPVAAAAPTAPEMGQPPAAVPPPPPPSDETAGTEFKSRFVLETGRTPVAPPDPDKLRIQLHGEYQLRSHTPQRLAASPVRNGHVDPIPRPDLSPVSLAALHPAHLVPRQSHAHRSDRRSPRLHRRPNDEPRGQCGNRIRRAHAHPGEATLALPRVSLSDRPIPRRPAAIPLGHGHPRERRGSSFDVRGLLRRLDHRAHRLCHPPRRQRIARHRRHRRRPRVQGRDRRSDRRRSGVSRESWRRFIRTRPTT